MLVVGKVRSPDLFLIGISPFPLGGSQLLPVEGRGEVNNLEQSLTAQRLYQQANFQNYWVRNQNH